MIRILLIRHGTTDLLGHVLYGRMPGVHLSAEGRKQARDLAHVLTGRYQLSEVVSSPMERTLETAEFIASAQHLAVSIDEDINEINFGAWQGKSFEELAGLEDWQRYNDLRSTYSPPGGEFMTEVQTRTCRAFRKAIARHQNENASTVAVVTHGDVIRAILILLLGMTLDHLHRLEIAPASASEVLMGSGQPRVRTINENFS